MVGIMGHGCTNFPKIKQQPQNFRYKKVDIKQVPYLGPTDIRCYCTKFSDLGDEMPGIYAPWN